MIKRILIAAATLLELKPLYDQLELPYPVSTDWQSWHGLAVGGLVTGPGLPMTAYHLGKALALGQPDVLIHIGISGSKADCFPIGQCVRISEDRYADIGAETDKGEFLSMFQLDLWDQSQPEWTNQAFQPKYAVWPDADLPVAKAITVNTIPGTKQSIDRMGTRFDFEIESMEGAAVFQVALTEDVPFICLRGISNFIEPRNRSGWDIQAALDSVTAEAMRFMNLIRHQEMADVNIILKKRDF